MLPMTDGVKLHTRIALPREYAGKKFITGTEVCL
jgi:predicted acyl esterase